MQPSEDINNPKYAESAIRHLQAQCIGLKSNIAALSKIAPPLSQQQGSALYKLLKQRHEVQVENRVLADKVYYSMLKDLKVTEIHIEITEKKLQLANLMKKQSEYTKDLGNDHSL